MRVCIETERLIIRNLEIKDAEDAFKWCGDPEVNTYLMYPLYHCAEDVAKWIGSLDKDNPDSYDLGFELKETGRVIGSGGFVYKPDKDVWEVGYNLAREFWGKGYVPEAMCGILAEIMKTREVKAIEGTFAAENRKSGRVMEKLGMTYDRDTEYTKMDGSATFKAKVYRRDY